MADAKREVAVAAVVLAMGLFFFVHLWFSTEQRLGAASRTTMPLIVTGAIVLLAAILLARNLGRLRAARIEAARRAQEATAAPEAPPTEERTRRRASAIRGGGLVAWTVLYLATLPWLGYLITTAVYIGGLSYLFGNRRPLAILLLMIVTPVALLLFFERYMVILLPSGSLFS